MKIRKRYTERQFCRLPIREVERLTGQRLSRTTRRQAERRMLEEHGPVPYGWWMEDGVGGDRTWFATAGELKAALVRIPGREWFFGCFEDSGCGDHGEYEERADAHIRTLGLEEVAGDMDYEVGHTPRREAEAAAVAAMRADRRLAAELDGDVGWTCADAIYGEVLWEAVATARDLKALLYREYGGEPVPEHPTSSTFRNRVLEMMDLGDARLTEDGTYTSGDGRHAVAFV